MLLLSGSVAHQSQSLKLFSLPIESFWLAILNLYRKINSQNDAIAAKWNGLQSMSSSEFIIDSIMQHYSLSEMGE